LPRPARRRCLSGRSANGADHSQGSQPRGRRQGKECCAGVQPNLEFEVNDTNTLFDLVEGGLGVTVIAEALVALLRPQLTWLPIKGRQWEWTIAAQALAPTPPNPAGRALWAMLPQL
jgi:DNA-binding transcriptional LysR family regulator